MAAPSPTARATPEGLKLDDGFSTLVTIGATVGADTDIKLWEKTVTPPGVDGGDAIETTTMHNTTWRTMTPRSLVTLTEMTFNAAYDPDVYDEVVAMINVETTITVTFPDGSTLAFFGFLKSFDPGECAEGTQPEATVTIVPTNFDSANDVEAAPLMTEVAGT